MWQIFLGVVIDPVHTFQKLRQEKDAFYPGVAVLLFVSFIYTLILVIFIQKDYTAAMPSLLGLPVQEQYQWQVWYQAPLFFATTALTGFLLTRISHLAERSINFRDAFGLISLATTVPFAMTTMLVELGIALLILFGVLAPDEALNWLTGKGMWFANLYQLIGLIWLVSLVVILMRSIFLKGWWKSLILGILFVIVYAFPIALFIR